MIRCPHCGYQSERVGATAPAIVETLKLVNADIALDDLHTGLRHDSLGRPYLSEFRLDGIVDSLDNDLGHRDLDLGEGVVFYCFECNGELDAALVWAAVEQKPEAFSGS